MPTTTGGLNFTYPNQGDKNWNSTWVTLANVISATTASGTSVDSTDGMGFAAMCGAVDPKPISGIGGMGMRVGPVRVSIASNTTYYLNAWGYAVTSFTNVTADGTIKAIRVG